MAAKCRPISVLTGHVRLRSVSIFSRSFDRFGKEMMRAGSYRRLRFVPWLLRFVWIVWSSAIDRHFADDPYWEDNPCSSFSVIDRRILVELLCCPSSPTSCRAIADAQIPRVWGCVTGLYHSVLVRFMRQFFYRGKKLPSYETFPNNLKT